MKPQMLPALYRTQRNKANPLSLADFLKCPANARIPREPLTAIRRTFKGGDGRGHRLAPDDWLMRSRAGYVQVLSDVRLLAR